MRGRLGRLAADNGAHSVGALWAAELLAAGALGQGGGVRASHSGSRKTQRKGWETEFRDRCLFRRKT